MKVRTAVDGVEALDSITSGAPDFVISDLAMRDMDGWELGRRLRMDYRLKNHLCFRGGPNMLLSGKTGTQDCLLQY